MTTSTSLVVLCFGSAPSGRILCAWQGYVNDRRDARTCEQIFAQIDSAEVVIVTGEPDNTFVPGGAAM